MESIKEALTFDDVLLTPKYSDVLPSQTNLFTELSKKINKSAQSQGLWQCRGWGTPNVGPTLRYKMDKW